MLCRTIFRFILFVPCVGALKVALYLVSFAIRDGEMTPCYFPSRVESWLFRCNVTVFQASGGSITSPFSGSIYSPSLLFLDQRKSELNSGQSRGIPCAIILSTHLNNVKKKYTDVSGISSRYFSMSCSCTVWYEHEYNS